MLIRKLASTAAVAALAFAGPALANQDMEGASPEQHGATQYDSHDALTTALLGELRNGIRVLVKGSRGSAMDNIVKAVLASETSAGEGATHAS